MSPSAPSYADRFGWYSEVVKNRALSPRVAHVAWIIIDCLNADTGCAWPSQKYIADALGVSEPTIKRSIHELREVGLLKVELGGGRGKSSFYRLAVPEPDEARAVDRPEAELAPEDDGGEPEKGFKSDPKGVQICTEKGFRNDPGTSLRTSVRTSSAPAPEIRDAGPDNQPPSSATAQPEPAQPGRSVAGLLSKEANRSGRQGANYQQRHADDGEMERQLAERLGDGDVAAGFGIVFSLDSERLRQLRDAVRFGRLDVAMIEDARLTARMAGPVPVDDQIIKRDASMRFTPPRGDHSMGSDESPGLIEHRTRQHHAQT